MGWKKAFDYQMGDYLWLGFVLGLKWGILKFSDFVKIGERRRTSRNSDWFTPTLNNNSRNTFGRFDFEKQTNFRLVRPDFDFLILQSLNFTFQLENVLK